MKRYTSEVTIAEGLFVPNTRLYVDDELALAHAVGVLGASLEKDSLIPQQPKPACERPDHGILAEEAQFLTRIATASM